MIDCFLQMSNSSIEVRLNIRNQYKQKIPITYTGLTAIVHNTAYDINK